MANIDNFSNKEVLTSAKMNRLVARVNASVPVYDLGNLIDSNTTIQEDAFQLKYGELQSFDTRVEILAGGKELRFDCYAHVFDVNVSSNYELPYIGSVMEYTNNAWRLNSSISSENGTDYTVWFSDYAQYTDSDTEEKIKQIFLETIHNDDEINEKLSELEGNIGNLSNLETSVKTDLVSAINEARQSGGGGGGGSTIVVDNLTSTSTTSALSANQGRVLKGLVDAKGTYTKPTNGIPKTDLASDVQTSLGKADTALQSHQSLSAYRKASAQDAIDATKATKIGVASAIPSGGMLPNTFYNLGELSGSVSLTMADATDNTIVNVWSFQFSTSATAPSITWDAKITKWQGGNAPTINASKTYEVSVLNGICLIVEV